jgi:hypothetical protein
VNRPTGETMWGSCSAGRLSKRLICASCFARS